MSYTKEDLKKLTLAQEAIVTTMWLVEERYKAYTNKELILWVSGSFFSMHLGLNWQGYHRKLMRRLEHLRWIMSWRRDGVIFYTLTEAARVRKMEQQSASSSYLFCGDAEAPF